MAMSRPSFTSAAILVAIASAGGALAFAQAPSDVLSLDDAIRMSAERDPRLAAAYAHRRRQDADATAARGRLLPRVDFEQAMMRGDQPVYAFGSRLLQGRFGAADLALPALNGPAAITDHASRLHITVPLVHVEGWVAARAANQRARAAEAQLTQAELELLAQVERTYGEAQFANEGARVAAEVVEAARADAERMRSMVRHDAATELDALTFEMHLASMEERAIDAQGAAESAQATLNQAVGLPMSARPRLSTSAESAYADARFDSSGPDLDVDTARVAEHPVVITAEANEAAAEATRRSARARFAPVLAASADLQSHRSALVGGQHGESWTVGLVLQLNLFNGLQDLAYARAASAGLEAARIDAADAEATVRLRIRRAQLALRSAEARVAVGARGVELARSADELQRHRSERGMSDASQLVHAHTDLLEAELRHLQGLHARHMARVELRVALGDISSRTEEVSP